MVLLTLAIILIGSVIFFASFFFLGRYLPPVPFLNEWKVKVTLWQPRGNGVFPRDDRARNMINSNGEESFELKKMNIKTAPRKLIEAYRGTDGHDYIHLLQVSKTSAVPMKIEFFKELDNQNNPLDQEALKLIVKDENVYKWKEQMMRDQARKVTRTAEGLLDKLGAFAPIMTILIFVIMLTLLVEPVNNYFNAAGTLIARMEQTATVMQQVQETNIQVLDRLLPIADAIGG